MTDDRIADFQSQLQALCSSNSPVVWVFGSSINALSFVRSLGRKGFACAVIDDAPMIGAFSKYTKFAQASITDLSSERGLAALISVAKKSKHQPVIFATSDSHNEFLARNGHRLRDFCRFCIPNPDTIDALIDKKEQYRRASNIGIPLPLCIYPDGVEYIKSNSRIFTFPCIVKPCKAHVGRKFLNGKKVKVVNSHDELINAWTLLDEVSNEFMVQEIIPGGDDGLFGYLAFWSNDSEEVAWVTKQKLRQNPPVYGDGALQVSVECPEVRDLSIRLLKEFNYKGFVGVEFKLDPRDQIFKLMEINPRTVSGNQLAISAGVDFPYIGLRYLTDDNFHYNGDFMRNVQFVNEDWDFRSCFVLRKTREAKIGDYLHDIFYSQSKAIWAADDLVPVWITLKSILGDMVRKVLRILKVNKFRNLD